MCACFGPSMALYIPGRSLANLPANFLNMGSEEGVLLTPELGVKMGSDESVHLTPSSRPYSVFDSVLRRAGVGGEAFAAGQDGSDATHAVGAVGAEADDGRALLEVVDAER